jgi:ribosomal protein S18 acetylase RimI-like enzyme
MKDPPEDIAAWIRKKLENPPRVFVAETDSAIAAYIEVCEEGENYIAAAPDTLNICGAYCLPEHRGSGAAQAVLAYVLETIHAEGIARLGVDCETFNPTALGFWRKYFAEYTHSVVRRIDENAF